MPVPMAKRRAMGSRIGGVSSTTAQGDRVRGIAHPGGNIFQVLRPSPPPLSTARHAILFLITLLNFLNMRGGLLLMLFLSFLTMPHTKRTHLLSAFGRGVAALYVVSICIHPENRKGDVEALLRAWRFLEKKTDYVFLAGDFNCVDKHAPQLWDKFLMQFQCSDVYPELATYRHSKGVSCCEFQQRLCYSVLQLWFCGLPYIRTDSPC